MIEGQSDAVVGQRGLAEGNPAGRGSFRSHLFFDSTTSPSFPTSPILWTAPVGRAGSRLDHIGLDKKDPLLST